MKYISHKDKFVKIESVEIERWQSDDFGEVTWNLSINKGYPSSFKIQCKSINEAKIYLDRFKLTDMYGDYIVEI